MKSPNEKIRFFCNSIHQNIIEKRQNLHKKLIFWNSLSQNIYNELSIIWLVANSYQNRYENEYISLEDFRKAFLKKFSNGSDQILEKKIAIFYKYAILIWEKLESTSHIEKIQMAILEIVAASICDNLGESNLSKILFEGICFLIYDRKELITVEGFLNIIKFKIGLIWFENENYEKICIDYYNFSRQFILIDFPMASLEFSLIKSVKVFIGNTVKSLEQKIFHLIDLKIRNAFYAVETNLDNVFYVTQALTIGNGNQLSNYEDFEVETFEKKKKSDIFMNIIEKSDEITNLFGSAIFNYLISSRLIKIMKFLDLKIEISTKIIMLILILNSMREKMFSEKDIRYLLVFLLKNVRNIDFFIKIAFKNMINIKNAKNNSYYLYQETKSKLMNAQRNLKEKAVRLKEEKLGF